MWEADSQQKPGDKQELSPSAFGGSVAPADTSASDFQPPEWRERLSAVLCHPVRGALLQQLIYFIGSLPEGGGVGGSGR